MSRDDSSGGWVPLGGGGLSNVSVRKRARITPPLPPATQPPPPDTSSTATTTLDDTTPSPPVLASPPPPPPPPPPPTKPKHDYLIYGMRISDECPVLACTIKKDFVYNKVMPTFHHWKTEDKKFGLTFQTAADARAFDKGVRIAVEELLDGYSDGASVYPPTVYAHNKFRKEVGDDDVFMTLNLPQEAPNSRSSSDSSSKGSEQNIHHHQYHHHHHLLLQAQQQQRQYLSSTKDAHRQQQHAYEAAIIKGSGKEPAANNGDTEKSENYSYVQLTTVHEYMYPIVPDDEKSPAGVGRRDSTGSVKKSSLELITTTTSQPGKTSSSGGGGGVGGGGGSGTGSLTGIGGGGGGATTSAAGSAAARIKLRCRYCQDLYFADRNWRGACDYAPDAVRAGIDKLTCIACAQCVSYHCAADAEGDFAAHPCDCGADDNCGRRWACLTLLAIFVPCLWCYPPLKLCHWCGVQCGVCGGRHRVAQN